MAAKSASQLLVEFQRPGRRSLQEARVLLAAWGFEERRTKGGHAVWVHPRGTTLTITTTRELAVCYVKLVTRKILELDFPKI